MSNTWRRLGWVCACALGLAACKSEQQGDAVPVGRGSPVCNEWQTALCDRVARCGALPERVEVCRHQASSITCTSDAEAAGCVSSLESTSCAASPGACDLDDLADPAPARAACQRWVEVLCQAYERCGQGTKAECLALPETSALCVSVIGHALTAEQCEQELATYPCAAEELPLSCREAFLRQP